MKYLAWMLIICLCSGCAVKRSCSIELTGRKDKRDFKDSQIGLTVKYTTEF